MMSSRNEDESDDDDDNAPSSRRDLMAPNIVNDLSALDKSRNDLR